MPRITAFLLAGAAALAACHAENAKLETSLFANKSLAGTEFVTNPPVDLATVSHFNDDGSLALVGKPLGFIETTATYHNYRLHVEWRWPVHTPKNANGGVLLHIASGPKDRVWPLCFQMQLKPGRAGDMLPMAGATFAEKLSTPPNAKTPILDRSGPECEKPLGEWNACDIVCRDGTIEVTINGIAENKVTHVSPDSGKVGIQFEGWPHELRNVRIEPLE